MTRQSLTMLARQAIAATLRPGDRAIDATVGNGHDTLLLAQSTAPGGRVIGFDVQPAALAGARARLQAAGLAGAVDLVHAGHEAMNRHVPAEWHGTVAAVMFNLGFLPGGDKRLITRAPTTREALQQALVLLRPGGLISLLVYRGHPGAAPEVEAVGDWLQSLDAGHRVTRHASAGPVLYLIETRG